MIREHLTCDFKFLKPQSKTPTDFPKELPDPNGPLSKTILLSVIEMANDEQKGQYKIYVYSLMARSQHFRQTADQFMKC